MTSTSTKVIRMADYGRRMRKSVHAQVVHDRIAQALKGSQRVCLDFADVESIGATFLDRSLGALVAWHGATILQLLEFEHCSRSVALNRSGSRAPRHGRRARGPEPRPERFHRAGSGPQAAGAPEAGPQEDLATVAT